VPGLEVFLGSVRHADRLGHLELAPHVLEAEVVQAVLVVPPGQREAVRTTPRREALAEGDEII
jgi:hypothetical protein